MRTGIITAGLWLCCSCVEKVKVDNEETGVLVPPPVAEFDPSNRVLPLPNNLLLDPATGRLNLPAPCGEEPDSTASRLRLALNELDGFSTSATSIVASFSRAVDAASLEGRVFLVRLAQAGQPVSFEGLVPVDVVPGSTLRFDASCASTQPVATINIRPRRPLAGSSTYAVVLLSGIASLDGTPFEPSATWGLVRQSQAPVTFSSGANPVVTHNATPFDPRTPEGLASLQGLDRLWRAHAPILSAFDRLAPALAPNESLGRHDVLLAWAFPTQTIAEPFDPDVEGSPAAALADVTDELVLPSALAGAGAPLSIEAFFANALPGTPCGALGCDAIGWIYAGGAAPPHFTSPSFLSGDDCDPSTAEPLGAFEQPVAPAKVCDQELELIVVVPSAPPPSAGYPTVVFAHGLARSKEDSLALAGTLARAGFASVAFDAVDHGSRAVRISSDAALGCDGAGPTKPCTATFGPTCAPQCFAPLLSANLPVTRDHLRQTVLDQQQLVRVLRGCSEPAACGRLQVDGARIGYVGHALGALLGAVSASLGGVAAAALNEPAGDWLGVLADTQTLGLRCTLVDALIGAGVLHGETWDGGRNDDALCLGDSWKTERGYLEFAAAARWLLDPVDPVNYAARYATESAPPLLLMEVVDDTLIPNSATFSFTGLLDVDPAPVTIASSAMPEPSPAALRGGVQWLRYRPLPADSKRMFPGNAYGPGSLLSPAEPTPAMGAPAGQLGTALMRVDLATFLGGRL